MCCEIVVTCKDDESSLKQKFLIYEPFTFVQDDPIMMECIQSAKSNFKSDSDDIDIRVRCLMVVQ